MTAFYSVHQSSNESIYQKMIEEVEDYAILLLNREGIIQNWNKGAEKIKGYTAEEIVGQHYRLFYNKQDQELHLPEQLLKEAYIQGKARAEGWRVRKDGSRFWSSVTISALHDDDDQVIGYTKVTRDLTERKLAEDRLRQYTRQLERQNQELEQFTYIASHDLQEPLRTVSGFVELLQRGYSSQLDQMAQKYLQYVAEATGRMQELIKGLLDYSRLGRQKNQEWVDCQSLVREVLQDLQAAIQEAKASIQVKTLPQLWAYPLELKLLLQNLIGNALKFSRKGTSPDIEVSAVAKNNFWEFAISDNGIGIEERFREKVFVIFQRLHDKNLYQGTGIGLAHCKKIVSLHGGDIWVGAHAGEGSTFYFTIPMKHE